MDVNNIITIASLVVGFVVGLPSLILLFFKIRKWVLGRRAQKAATPDAESVGLEASSTNADINQSSTSPSTPLNRGVIFQYFHFHGRPHPDIATSLPAYPQRALIQDVEELPITSLRGPRAGTWPIRGR